MLMNTQAGSFPLGAKKPPLTIFPISRAGHVSAMPCCADCVAMTVFPLAMLPGWPGELFRPGPKKIPKPTVT